jgi:hypothetical protein
MLSLLVWLSGCGLTTQGESQVSLPGDARIGDITWTDNGEVIVVDLRDSAPLRLWNIRGNTAEQIQVPDIPGACESPLSGPTFELPTGWGVLAACGDGPDHIAGVFEAGTQLLATVRVSGIQDLAWDASAKTGVLHQSIFDCSTLIPVSEGNPVAWPAVLAARLLEEGLSPYPVGERADCEQYGNAGWPAFDADGWLYFAGSAAARGVRDTDRYDKEHTLYRVHIKRGQLEKLATGFTNVSQVSVTSDGSVVAVFAKRGGKNGLYTIRPATNQVCYHGYSDMNFAAIAPDGKLVAVVQSHNKLRIARLESDCPQ